MITVREVKSTDKKLINDIVTIHLNTFTVSSLLLWEEDF